MATADSPLLMVDPSFLLSEEGTQWLLDELGAALEGIIVSATFLTGLQESVPAEAMRRLVAPEDVPSFEQRAALLREMLTGVQAFSYESADLDQPDRDVLSALLELGGLEGAILADEWAFLQSHSWAISKLHRPLDAFRDAGAAVVEYGRRLRDEMINVVVPSGAAPGVLTSRVIAKASAKWLIVGGASAGGALLGPLAAGIAGTGIAVPVVRAFDP